MRYVINEAIEFCVDFMDELSLIRLPVPCHEGRLGVRALLEGKKI